MRDLSKTTPEEVAEIISSIGEQAKRRDGHSSVKQLSKYAGPVRNALSKLPPRKDESAHAWLPRAVKHRYITPGMERSIRMGWDARGEFRYVNLSSTKLATMAFLYMEKFKNSIPDKQYASLGALVNILTRKGTPARRGVSIEYLLKNPALTVQEKEAVTDGIAAMCDFKPVAIKVIESPPIATKTREIKVSIPLNDLHNLQDYDRSKDFEWNWNNLLRLMEQQHKTLRASTGAHKEAEARYTKVCDERSALHKRHNDLHVERNILQNTLNVERENADGKLLKATSERMELENALKEANRVNDRLTAMLHRFRNFIIETLDDIEA